MDVEALRDWGWRISDPVGRKGGNANWFILYVTLVIAVSLLVSIFKLMNKGTTQLDREQGSAWAAAVPSGPR